MRNLGCGMRNIFLCFSFFGFFFEKSVVELFFVVVLCVTLISFFALDSLREFSLLFMTMLLMRSMDISHSHQFNLEIEILVQIQASALSRAGRCVAEVRPRTRVREHHSRHASTRDTQ